jgi:hypothetical protein
MKRILFLLTLIILFSGCKNRGSFSVNGVIKGKTEKYIKINRLDVENSVFIDSSKIRGNGKFRFRIKASESDFYQVGFSSGNFITLLAEPGEKIKLVFENKNLFEKYSITGSAGSEKLQVLDQTLDATKRKLDSLSSEYTKASGETGFDVKGPSLQTEFSKILSDQRKKNIEFIIANLNSLASIKAVYQKINPDTYVLYEPRDLQYLKIVTDSLTHYYPNSKHVKALSLDFQKELNQMYMGKFAELTKSLPETKLDIVLKDNNGNRIALSSLSEKYVLVTFWSIQSQECIAENLLLKELYRKYKTKGFQIYQINLDENESAWKSAVKFDELPWISTREDDPLNPVNAKLFNVKVLPQNYIFDKSGEIVASNLHGRSLQIKLEQLFR